MEKKSLKSIVIGYKLSGLSYADIAARLEEEYDIKMSRQAVNGLYKRATSDKETEKNIQTVIRTTDICYFNALGYTVKEIKELINDDNFDLSLNKINDILSNNSELISDIESHIIDKINTGLKNKENIDLIIHSLKFKDVNIKNKKWEKFLEEATKAYITDAVINSYASILEITNNRDLIRCMMKEFNIQTSFKELGQILKRD